MGGRTMPGMASTLPTLRQAGGLPPKRTDGQLSFVNREPVPSNLDDSINIPRARDRLLEFFERKQVPNDVADTLAAALNGNLHYQHLLFIAMMDTWPKLQKNINHMAGLATKAPWKVVPYSHRSDVPEPKAQELADDVQDIIFCMRPNAARMEHGFKGTVRNLAVGYFFGHAVSAINWTKAADGSWKIQSTKAMPARYYAYPYAFISGDDESDRLMFNPTGMLGNVDLTDFPDNRFLVGVNQGHPGHPAVAAPLRALSAYWLAAVYGLSWFMNFVQLYGIPFRHAEVADKKDDNEVAKFLSQIGSLGYVITRPGTKINILDAPASKGGRYPQTELLDIADKQCDIFILGQTLTSGTDSSGSRALGEVHQDTQDDMAETLTGWIGDVLTYQLVPSVVSVNWGMREDLPTVSAKPEEVIDEQSRATRMQAVKTMGLPVEKSWAYDNLGIPVPEDGAETLFGLAEPDPALPPVPGAPVPPMMPPPKFPKVTAADATGEKTMTIDQLSASVMEGLTGVTKEWLSPVKPFFDRLAALAMSKHVTDEDFIVALEKAQKQLPELFDKLDTEALQTAFENAIGSAMLAGGVSRYE